MPDLMLRDLPPKMMREVEDWAALPPDHAWKPRLWNCCESPCTCPLTDKSG